MLQEVIRVEEVEKASRAKKLLVHGLSRQMKVSFVLLGTYQSYVALKRK